MKNRKVNTLNILNWTISIIHLQRHTSYKSLPTFIFLSKRYSFFWGVAKSTMQWSTMQLSKSRIEDSIWVRLDGGSRKILKRKNWMKFNQVIVEYCIISVSLSLVNLISSCDLEDSFSNMAMVGCMASCGTYSQDMQKPYNTKNPNTSPWRYCM